ncbi:sialyltransferase [Methanobrevibacter sp. YE315]|uniref:sialyltransferase n=1 Tax=Methanobrevibacter sp. YE315 TaxID=1609968 RepID=UPI000764D238|nr:sialyltransferase [Methanobrevibacter sp. YE315]AMD18129.1 sialyltransferase [Methanobrevibacter sp. YE315]
MSFSVSDVCNVFFNLEEKYNLNYQEIQGCFPWQLIRMYLYYDITRRTNTFGAPQQQSLSLFDKIKSFVPFVKNSLFHNPFSGSQQKDILIFDHPRKVLFNGEYKDIYSYFLVDFLKDSRSFEVLESPYLNEHFTNKQNYIKYTDRIQLGSYIYKKFHKIEFSSDEKELISNIENDLENEFNIKINLSDILKMHILNFQYDYKKYTELFKKRKPKKIFVVVAYENQAIVAAAKDLKIEVIELQHGTISKYHLGYSYPLKTRSDDEIKYFPNKILTFGDYWINDEYSPISKKNIIPIGFPYFEEQSREYMDIKSNPNQILFISQGVIGRYMANLAYESAKKLENFKIIYKLHPGEYENWKQNYPDLVKASNLGNFDVIDNSQTPLYKLFAESNYQVGAFSTAIYEGLMFNCKTFILNVPGIEYLDDLIERGYVFKINDVSDLVDNLNEFEPSKYDKDFFFKNLDKELLKGVIDNG